MSNDAYQPDETKATRDIGYTIVLDLDSYSRKSITRTIKQLYAARNWMVGQRPITVDAAVLAALQTLGVQVYAPTLPPDWKLQRNSIETTEPIGIDPADCIEES